MLNKKIKTTKISSGGERNGIFVKIWTSENFPQYSKQYNDTPGRADLIQFLMTSMKDCSGVQNLYLSYEEALQLHTVYKKPYFLIRHARSVSDTTSRALHLTVQ